MKLDGVTVIDLSLFLPGPAATQMMADHGARVIKVENPKSPEPTRSSQSFPWQQGGETVMFRNTQRGKESIALDLKSDAGKAALAELIKGADVLVEAFRPGVAARLGFGPEAVRALNPKIVYCSISAFGQSGPWRDKPAHDTATVAASGVLSLSCSPEGDSGPAIIGVAISDMLSSWAALSGILMALFRRETTGEGDYLDVSMHESVLAASPNILGPVFAGKQAPRQLAERSHGGGAMLNIYRTADDRFLALGGGEHKFVSALFEGLNHPEFIHAVAGPAGTAHEPAIRFLRETFRAKTLTDWELWFEGRDICWSPVLDLNEAWSAEHVSARGMRWQDNDGNDHIGTPLKFQREPAAIDASLPSVGQNTSDIINDLDLTPAQRTAILEVLE
ncbi:CaiB/BaiF CoA transferase family protein [Luminiphilus sp. nBUS_07]|uniref:CaiB/BaiF CoA transferase family protein n=1 Tax=Luminiphilus sp. nBUS_07 TaxID=3395314 RepID=UPI003EBE3AA4